MSFLSAIPQLMAQAANDLAGIGSTINEANTAASVATTGLLAPAADEVSEAVAALFASHGQTYQALSAQVAHFHDQFVQLLNAGAASYAGAEAANASPLQALLSQGPFGQLEQAELSFGSNMVSRQMSFDHSLLTTEVGLEQQLFGTDSALNGALNRGFNAVNLLVGTGQQTADSLLGVTVPSNFYANLLTGSGAQVFNGGQIGGLIGVVDQSLMVPTDLAGLVVGNTSPAHAAMSALAAAPASPFGQLEQTELNFGSNLVNHQMGLDHSLLTNEVGLEQQLFGTDSALNGALNRSFNAVNLTVGTVQQTADSLLGVTVPSNFYANMLTGSGAQVFNGGQIGGLAGVFDQSLMVPTDLAGLIAGNGSPAQAALSLSPTGQLQQTELNFDGNLVNHQMGLDHSLLTNEVGLEQQLFGTDSALNGALNRSFNAANLMVGTVQQTADSLLGVTVPSNFYTNMLTGSAAQVFNGGQIGGLLGVFDQSLMVPTDLAGLIAGDGSPAQAAFGLSSLAAAPTSPFGQLEQAELNFGSNMVNHQMGLDHSLLTNEVGLEQQLFGTDSALNGVVNRSFNAANLMVGTVQQTGDSLLGVIVPPDFYSNMLTGSGAQVFNGGQIGGLIGVLDQTVMVPIDLAGLIAG